MPTFTGMLSTNQIFTTLFNMIISQEVFSDDIRGTYSSLVDRGRVDGTLYGDTKLYYATSALKTYPFLADAEAQNLLAINRPKAPQVQAIKLNVFRQIRVTTDEFLSKQAYATEGAFSALNSRIIGWIRDTKRIYDSTLYNAFIGTNTSNIGLQSQQITIAQDANFALTVAEKLANLLVELKDVSREYNDYGNIRSFSEADLIIVWNSAVINSIRNIDLPTIFHNKGLLDEFDEEILPEKYFGTIATEGGNTTANNISIRALYESDYTVASQAADSRAEQINGQWVVHLFPGELLPNSVAYEANQVYTQNDNIAFKIIHKRSVPYMSAAEVGTSWFNARSLTTNRYLTYGHNELEHLKNYPFITVTYNEA